MLLAQSIEISEIPGWVLYAFIVALVIGLVFATRWVLTHSDPE
jgi:hypothetical protein